MEFRAGFISRRGDGVSHGIYRKNRHAHEIGGMQEQMSRKREREALLMQSLQGMKRTLRIQSTTARRRSRLPTSELSETGGIEGLLIFTTRARTPSRTPTRTSCGSCSRRATFPPFPMCGTTFKQAGVELLTMKVEVASPDEPNAQDCPLKVVTRSCLPPVWTVWRGTTYGEGVCCRSAVLA